MDVVASALGLLLLAPFLAGIAIWIRTDSPGPALFKQVRVGRAGRHFQILKFRTMVTGADRIGGGLTVGKDPRITRAGEVLRRYKLDELPQLINVLKGEMSLVGPRPELPRYVDGYPDDLKRLILSIKPGITDEASLTYRNENALLANSEDPERTYLEEILPKKLALYAEYASNHNLLMDVAIICRTLRALVR